MDDLLLPPLRAARPGSGEVGKRGADVTTLVARDIYLRHAMKVAKRLAFEAEEADTAASRIAACKEINDRAFGKAAQAVNIGGLPDGEPIRFALVERVIVDPQATDTNS